MMYSVYKVLNLLFNLLELAIIIECASSWIPQIQGSKYIKLIHNFIYPVLEPFRRLQDRIIPGLPMDFSPICAFFVLNLLRNVIFALL